MGINGIALKSYFSCSVLTAFHVKPNMQKGIAFLAIIFLLVSCWDFRKQPLYKPHKVLGYKPVYSNDSSLLRVQAMGPQPVKFPGKIYIKGTLIFQNDIGYGIHVINNSDPSVASRIGFIQLRGNSEMSIKGNYLYANSYADLVVIDISNWRNVTEVKRIRNAFTQGHTIYNFIPLPEHKVYYDCPNFNNGIQIGWVRDSVNETSCYYP